MIELLKLFFPILKRITDKLFPDPQEQAEIQKQLMALEAEINTRAEEAFVKYIEATQPKSERVYVWANTLIALVRPALAVFVVVSPIFFTEKWVQFLKVLQDAGVWGAIALAPAWVWVLGRDGVRMILGIVASLRGTQIPVEALPPGISQPSPRKEIPTPSDPWRPEPSGPGDK